MTPLNDPTQMTTLSYLILALSSDTSSDFLLLDTSACCNSINVAPEQHSIFHPISMPQPKLLLTQFLLLALPDILRVAID